MDNQTNSSLEYSSLEYNFLDYSSEVRKCCFCGDDCNASSQSCGSCARDMNMMSMGWNIKKYTPRKKRKVSDKS